MCNVIDDIPEKGQRTKALRIHEQLTTGAVRYEQVKGKRLGRDRTLISVPIGMYYRLVYRERDDGLHLLHCLTHAAYNTLVKRL